MKKNKNHSVSRNLTIVTRRPRQRKIYPNKGNIPMLKCDKCKKVKRFKFHKKYGKVCPSCRVKRKRWDPDEHPNEWKCKACGTWNVVETGMCGHCGREYGWEPISNSGRRKKIIDSES